MRYDFSPTGYTITDELVNRASTQPQFLSHDLIKSSSIDVWTGPGNTGTRLIKNVDYSLTIKDIKRSEMAGFDIYTLFAIINPAFLSVNVYVSFVTCGDYVSIAGIQDIIGDMVDISSIPTPGQKAALAGSRGTPGSANKYLTQASIGNEVCALEGGVIPAGVIPGYIDDLQEVYVVGSTPYAADWLSLTAGGAPLSPVGGRLYLVVSAGNYYHKSYRWAGTAYGITGSDLALGETSSTAYRGDRGKTAYDHSQTAHAPSNADNTQAAINAASGKTTPSDNDLLALLDSDAGNALKKLLWSNVKATLKTYFDTLYTSSGGDTPANILAKLLTVDGYNSGLVSEDSGKVGGRQASSFVYDNPAVITSGSVLSVFTKSGFYTAISSATDQPSSATYLYFVNVYDTNSKAVLAMSAHNPGSFYLRTHTIGGWSSSWISIYNAANVGSGWATALGASKYSLGTRVLTSTTVTSGYYIIPEGEYVAYFALEGNSNGVLQIYSSGNTWISLASFATLTVAAGSFNYGFIRSDGTNMRVFWVAGLVQIHLMRIG